MKWFRRNIKISKLNVISQTQKNKQTQNCKLKEKQKKSEKLNKVGIQSKQLYRFYFSKHPLLV